MVSIKSVSTVDKNIALHYMQTLSDVARESFLILDSNLIVLIANPTFYEVFRSSPKQTENVSFYELGNGQWNIPDLKKLLEDILPNKKVVKDYEVTHVFETIGQKTMVLNARQIDSAQVIILALEDISVRKQLENQVANHVIELANKVSEKTKNLTDKIKELETINKDMVGRELKMVELKKEIEDLKKRIKNGNGNHNNG
jgi:nitrogen-specific signal transduction histidine kinase